MTSFEIDQLVAEARRVSQQIGTTSRALFEAFENVAIDMHHFSNQMKNNADRTEQQTTKLEQHLSSIQKEGSDIKADVGTIKSDVAIVKEKVAKIDVLETHLLTIRMTFSSINGKLDQQAGLLDEFL